MPDDPREVSLREYLEAQIRAIQEQHAALETVRLRELALARDVTEQTRRAMDAKLLEMNELRRQLEGERALYVTRDMMDARIKGVEIRVDANQTTFMARLETLERSLAARLDIVERYKSNLDGRFTVLGIVMIVLSTLIGWVMRFIGRP